ncbi:MAG: flagellar type III secretion system pore protein FliP [Thermoguttaceae bacterium]|nr:flagellar type III secretion system pore protein FliP [Thermoguttaceae bacterium]
MGSTGTLLALGVLTLAPALIVMTTSFVRIVVVLGLLRQALGIQNLPPQQVITGLALFITFFVMYPVGNAIYNDALKPYEEGKITVTDAWDIGVKPLRQFMSNQIQKAGNDADVWLFWRADPNAPTGAAAQNLTYDDVPLHVLVPAFMTSELKIAFLMGVKLFIPFLIIDFLVSAITVSMGIMTLPPVMISLPLKLLLFVMLDGWRLTVEMLLTSFG